MKKNKGKKWNRWTNFDTIVTIVVFFAVVVTLYPLVYVVSCSISDPLMVLGGKVKLWPVGFTLDAYKIVVAKSDFWRCFVNSIGYVIANCIFMFFNTVVVSYPLTRPNLKFRKLLTYFLLIPMYFGGGMIPSFLLVCNLGLYNSPWSLILPGCFSIWNIILCRTFMASLPGELIDSALIDGSDQIRTLWKIVIPLSKPVIAVIMIYTIVGVWNSWFGASIYTTNKEIWPIQLYLKNALASTSGELSKELMAALSREELEAYRQMSLSANQLKYAMIVITVLPIVCVYPMFQKYFTKGIMLGSLKG